MKHIRRKQQGDQAMLSRTANSIYWMSRYLERADNVARFIDVNTRLILDMGRARQDAQWEPLVLATGDEEEFKSRYTTFDEHSTVKFLTFDKENPNSILSCVQHVRENARTVREIISSEMWENINALYHLVRKHSRKREIDDLQKFLKQVHQATHLFAGLIENTMSHTESWHFARMGRLIERADKTARMLDVKYFLLLPTGETVDSLQDTVEWGAVLKSVSGFEMYRKQFHRAQYKNVTQFLILDEDFPRAINYCINMAARSLMIIVKSLEIENTASQAMSQFQKFLAGATIEDILAIGLHEFIDEIQLKLNTVDQCIYQSFFALKESEATAHKVDKQVS